MQHRSIESRRHLCSLFHVIDSAVENVNSFNDEFKKCELVAGFRGSSLIGSEIFAQLNRIKLFCVDVTPTEQYIEFID